MRLFFKTSMLLFALKVISTNKTQECPAEHFIIVDKNDKKVNCLSCENCPVGSGLNHPCGSRILETANVECNRCDPGRTYSEDHGPSSCKPCHICSVTVKNCTPESDTKCSKVCRKGYYYDNSTYDCQPCSYCCREDNKKVAECKVQGQPLYSQCNVHDALECSVKTTKNPSNGYTHNKSSTIVIFVIVGTVIIGAVVLVVLVVLFCWFLVVKHRRERPNNIPEEIPFENNVCGINGSFSKIVNSSNPNQLAREGDEVQLICVRGRGSQDNCRYTYKWKKDLADCHHGTSTSIIKLHQILVKDFGKYTCQISCTQHLETTEIELDLGVLPGPSKRYKFFKDINSYQLYNKIADMLKSPPTGLGNWKCVAENYSLGYQAIQSLQESDKRAMEVIDYIISRHTKLTVYKFCKFMKEIKQNQIVDVLENHLTCEKVVPESDEAQNIASTIYAPNGFAVGPESDEAQSIEPNKYGENIGLINSRDELAGKNPEKIQQTFNLSSESQKSSGSGSSNSMLRTAKGFVRQISQNSSYMKQENEHNEPP